MRERVRRSLWMRLLFPLRRLYWCRFCRATMLMPPPAPEARLPWPAAGRAPRA